MKSIELETIKIRLEGVRLAIARCRFAFLVSMVASVAIIVTVWNAYMSPESGYALQPQWSHDRQFTPEMQQQRLDSSLAGRKLSPEKVTEVTDQVQQEIVAEWIKNQVISVGLLGIRISVEDFSVLGSLGLLISAMMLFYTVRSENLCIGNLLKHAHKFPEWDDRYLVFQGVIPYLIFFDMGHMKKPIHDFEKPNDLSRPVRLIPPNITILLLLPAITILIVVAADLWTLFRAPTPFRPSGLPLWIILERHELLWRLGFDGIAFIFFVWTLILCCGILNYANATGKLMAKFRTNLLRSCPSGPRELKNDDAPQLAHATGVPQPANG